MIFNIFYSCDKFLSVENQFLKLLKCACENLPSFRI